MTVYCAGANIFEDGSMITGLYVVQRGLVCEYVKTGENKSEIVRFVEAGTVLGALSTQNERYRLEAMAHEDATVCFFENKALYQMYLSNPKITFDLMLHFSQEYCQTAYRLKRIAHMNLREKIAEGLLYLASSFGLSQTNELTDRVNREDIAGLVCTTPQQVSRQLTEFENEGLISKRGRKIVLLKIDKLRSIVDFS